MKVSCPGNLLLLWCCRTLVPQLSRKKTEKGVPAQNEVLPLINTNYCLETYEYDNEIVIIHNVKGRLK